MASETCAGAAKFSIVDYRANDFLSVSPRHKQPVTDDLVLSVSHRTLGDGRSILLDRDQVRALHSWLGDWLAK